MENQIFFEWEDPTKPILVNMDSPLYGIEVMAHKMDNSSEKPVGYISWMLSTLL